MYTSTGFVFVLLCNVEALVGSETFVSGRLKNSIGERVLFRNNIACPRRLRTSELTLTA